jgi:hypothetical protein
LPTISRPSKKRGRLCQPTAYIRLSGEVVRTIEPHTEADPAALLLLQVEGDRHFTVLDIVLVGATAKSRKGTSAGRIRQVFRAADGEWESARVKTGLSSGEGLINEVRDPVKNGAKVIDPGRRGQAVARPRSRVRRYLTMMRRPGSVLSRVIRDAWDCRDLAVLTKNNPSHATGPHISIIGHITVEELLAKMDRTSMTNGYANRFLFACVRRARVLPHGGDLDDSAVRELAMRTRERITQARKVSRVMMTSDAREAWEHAYETLPNGKRGLLGAILGRAEAQTVRLALLYALRGGSDQIGVAHLSAALSVWRYCEASAAYIFGGVVAGKTEDVIAGAPRQAGETGMTRTEIRDLFGRHRKGHEFDSALHVLAASGKAKRTGGHHRRRRHAARPRSDLRHKRRKRQKRLNPICGRLRSLMSHHQPPHGLAPIRGTAWYGSPNVSIWS